MGFDTRRGFSFGDVVLVPLPHPDQGAAEQSTCVIISSNAYHDKRQHVLVMATAAQERPDVRRGEVAIRHWYDAGLDQPAVLQPVLATIAQRRVRLTIGRLHEQDLQGVRDLLRVILAG
jgi:hypothetical protein